MNFTKVLLKEWLRLRSSAELLFSFSIPFLLFFFLPFSAASLVTFSHLILFSTSFKWFWWTSCCIVVCRTSRLCTWGPHLLQPPNLSTAQPLSPLKWTKICGKWIISVLSCQFTSRFSWGELWRMSLHWQQREHRRLKYPVFRSFPPFFGSYSSSRNISTKRWELEREWQWSVTKTDAFKCCHIVQQTEITSAPSSSQQVPSFLFFVTLQLVWSLYTQLHFLYWY